jgi:hypothetical protein
LDALQRLVGQAFAEADRAPQRTLSTAETFLRWRSEDADIAYFVDDLVDAVPVRDPDAPMSHTLASDRHQIALTISDDALVGTIRPWSGGQGSVEYIGGSVPVDVDEDGSFYVDRPSVSSARLHFTDVDGETRTEWFPLEM